MEYEFNKYSNHELVWEDYVASKNDFLSSLPDFAVEAHTAANDLLWKFVNQLLRKACLMYLRSLIKGNLLEDNNDIHVYQIDLERADEETKALGTIWRNVLIHAGYLDVARQVERVMLEGSLLGPEFDKIPSFISRNDRIDDSGIDDSGNLQLQVEDKLNLAKKNHSLDDIGINSVMEGEIREQHDDEHSENSDTSELPLWQQQAKLFDHCSLYESAYYKMQSCGPPSLEATLETLTQSDPYCPRYRKPKRQIIKTIWESSAEWKPLPGIVLENGFYLPQAPAREIVKDNEKVVGSIFGQPSASLKPYTVIQKDPCKDHAEWQKEVIKVLDSTKREDSAWYSDNWHAEVDLFAKTSIPKRLHNSSSNASTNFQTLAYKVEPSGDAAPQIQGVEVAVIPRSLYQKQGGVFSEVTEEVDHAETEAPSLPLVPAQNETFLSSAMIGSKKMYERLHAKQLKRRRETRWVGEFKQKNREILMDQARPPSDIPKMMRLNLMEVLAEMQALDEKEQFLKEILHVTLEKFTEIGAVQATGLFESIEQILETRLKQLGESHKSICPDFKSLSSSLLCQVTGKNNSQDIDLEKCLLELPFKLAGKSVKVLVAIGR